jgi:hypothetical protein
LRASAVLGGFDSSGHVAARDPACLCPASLDDKEGSLEPRKEPKGRFRIVKLELRIAPAPAWGRMPAADVDGPRAGSAEHADPNPNPADLRDRPGGAVAPPAD